MLGQPVARRPKVRAGVGEACACLGVRGDAEWAGIATRWMAWHGRVTVPALGTTVDGIGSGRADAY